MIQHDTIVSCLSPALASLAFTMSGICGMVLRKLSWTTSHQWLQPCHGCRVIQCVWKEKNWENSWTPTLPQIAQALQTPQTMALGKRQNKTKKCRFFPSHIKWKVSNGRWNKCQSVLPQSAQGQILCLYNLYTIVQLPAAQQGWLWCLLCV